MADEPEFTITAYFELKCSAYFLSNNPEYLNLNCVDRVFADYCSLLLNILSKRNMCPPESCETVCCKSIAKFASNNALCPQRNCMKVCKKSFYHRKKRAEIYELSQRYMGYSEKLKQKHSVVRPRKDKFRKLVTSTQKQV